jgi:hypothetical protein
MHGYFFLLQKLVYQSSTLWDQTPAGVTYTNSVAATRLPFKNVVNNITRFTLMPNQDQSSLT